MEQQHAPLYDALVRHAKNYHSDFHVPGHKQGKVFDEAGRAVFRQLLNLDLTEVGDLDDLHQPTGVILQAQQLAAAAFSATQTWFLVGGSTAGNVALIMAACEPGDDIIIQRNSHKSLFNGCMLADARAICLQPEFNRAAGVYGGVTVAKLRNSLKRHPEAKAVFLMSSNYYGLVQPIEQLAAVCTEYGIPLFVDEAHGAHFSAHPALPPAAVACGATAVVQSTHKMLPAMTMGAMVHANGTSRLREKLQHTLSLIQSSSPSYPIMASLDLARRYYATRARLDVDKSLPLIQAIRDNIKQRDGWQALSLGDPYKIVLQRYGWSGYELEAGLMSQGVTLELSDSRNGLAVLPLQIEERHSETLLTAIDRWSHKVATPLQEANNVPSLHLPEISDPIRLAEVTRQIGEWCPLHEAEGRMAKRMVLPYPPGIPAILPGEIYTRSTTEDLLVLMHYGAQLQGIQGCTSNAWVEVVK